MELLQTIPTDLSAIGSISIWTILWVLLAAAGTLVGFYLVDEFVIKLIRNRKARSSAKRYFPIITSSTWLVFIIYIGYLLIAPQPIIGGAVLAILLIAFWRFVVDSVSGLVFRIQDNYRIGQRVQLKNAIGVIVHLRTTMVELESDDGESSMIPYSEFANQTIRKPSIQEQLKQFSIELNPESVVSIKELNLAMLRCPWIIADKNPRAVFNESTQLYRISGHTIDLKYLPKIRSYFK
ncbi:MAG: mechanosensitive ion channel [Flavobacteriales bacterium]|nr:mechanosensitive ion channel [Flavobacteriales bacterium]